MNKILFPMLYFLVVAPNIINAMIPYTPCHLTFNLGTASSLPHKVRINTIIPTANQSSIATRSLITLSSKNYPRTYFSSMKPTDPYRSPFYNISTEASKTHDKTQAQCKNLYSSCYSTFNKALMVELSLLRDGANNIAS